MTSENAEALDSACWMMKQHHMLTVYLNGFKMKFTCSIVCKGKGCLWVLQS